MNMTTGSVTLYPFGLAIALSALVCLLLWRRSCGKYHAYSFLLLCVPLALLVSRVFYCIARFSWFQEKGFSWFWKLDAGGFTFFGMIFGVLLAAFIASRIDRFSFAEMSDSLMPYLALFSALCRFSQWLAKPVCGIGYDLEAWFDVWQENTGMSLFLTGDDPAKFSFFPIALQGSYDLWYWAVFTLEALLMLGICVFLTKKKQEKPGNRTLIFLLLTALCQMVTESMKQDALRLGFVKTGQLMSAVLIVAIFAVICARTCQKKAWLTRFPLILLCIGVDVVMEFAVEKKIALIQDLPVFGCHLTTSLMSVCMGLIILSMRNRALPPEKE